MEQLTANGGDTNSSPSMGEIGGTAHGQWRRYEQLTVNGRDWNSSRPMAEIRTAHRPMGEIWNSSRPMAEIRTAHRQWARYGTAHGQWRRYEQLTINGRDMEQLTANGGDTNSSPPMGEIGLRVIWVSEIFPEITLKSSGGPPTNSSALKEISIFRHRNTQHAKWDQKAHRVSPEIFTSSASVHSSVAIYKQGRTRVPPRAHLGHFTRCHTGTATTTGSLAQSDRSLGP